MVVLTLFHVSTTWLKKLPSQDNKGEIHESFEMLLQPSSVWHAILDGVGRRRLILGSSLPCGGPQLSAQYFALLSSGGMCMCVYTHTGHL